MSAAGVDLQQIWQTAWRTLDALPPPDLYSTIVDRYAESQRAYHTLQHIRECFEHFEPARGLAEHPEEIAVAIWFHDAVYDVRAKDSEEQSADLAARLLQAAGAPETSTERIRELIIATKHGEVPVQIDAQLVVDTDLAILGSNPERFDEYERQVRQEYRWIPGLIYRRERRRILQAFLQRPRLYATDHFFELFEEPARANLNASIERLS